MSVLREYETIRRMLAEEHGESINKEIDKFLEEHKHYFLSDVYYKESVWREFEDWKKSN